MDTAKMTDSDQGNAPKTKVGMRLPGFEMLSKHVIKPLMFATEKVF